jgi:hypothetical protein
LKGHKKGHYHIHTKNCEYCHKLSLFDQRDAYHRRYIVLTDGELKSKIDRLQRILQAKRSPVAQNRFHQRRVQAARVVRHDNQRVLGQLDMSTTLKKRFHKQQADIAKRYHGHKGLDYRKFHHHDFSDKKKKRPKKGCKKCGHH